MLRASVVGRAARDAPTPAIGAWQAGASLEHESPPPHIPAMRQRRDERRPDLDPPTASAAPRPCAWPGCDAEGEYRAPRSRDALRDYQWLCLAHIREFNRQWDYFQGMSEREIDRHRREDTVWHRPTWRYSVRGLGPEIHDPLGILGELGPDATCEREAPPRRRYESKTERMLERLGLDGRAALDDVKRRYKILAKRHHPDLRGGDRAAEERLKLINEAYTYLLHCGELA
jgi:DnaJ-domain-containing protein 1